MGSLVGKTIEFKAAGKVSRLDGVAGHWVAGIVIKEDQDSIIVEKLYPSLIELASVPKTRIREI